MGRTPESKSGKARVYALSIRLTEEELAAIRGAAKAKKTTVTEWIRDRCLIHLVVPKVVG